MSRPYRLTDPVIDELIEVADFYERQRVGLGNDVRRAALTLVRSLTTQPFLYARVPRCPAGRDVRLGMTYRFPILVLYEVFSHEIVVLAVTHAKAHPRTWKRRLRS